MIAIQQWTISGLTNIDKLVYAGCELASSKPIANDIAERLANKIAVSADKLNIMNFSNRDKIADNVEILLDRLYSDFLVYKDSYESELEDRADFQLKNLAQNIDSQKESRKAAIRTAEEKYYNKKASGEFKHSHEHEVKKLDTTRRLNEGKIAKLNEKFELRSEQIKKSLHLTQEATDVTAILIEVTG